MRTEEQLQDIFVSQYLPSFPNFYLGTLRVLKLCFVGRAGFVTSHGTFVRNGVSSAIAFPSGNLGARYKEIVEGVQADSSSVSGPVLSPKDSTFTPIEFSIET